TDVSAQAAQLASLQDAYKRTAQYCDLIDERMREVNLNDEVGAINVSIVDSAAPGVETYPDRPKVLSMSLAFGAMLGFGLAWLRDLLDQRLKSVDEIAAVMHLPVIGAVPILTGLRGSGNDGRSEGGRIVATHPRSPAAEAVRTLRTALDFGLAGPESKVFVVTSPAPGDGKSTVASNLAITMAQANQRVLMIDADLRKPTQTEIFDVRADIGLSAVLTGDQAPEEVIAPSGVPSLDILPCGKRPSNPVELLNNGVLPEALRNLSEHYDKIVIDSPPVMPVADARIIAAMADCALLVLRADRSTRRLSVAARDELLKVRTQRLGVVVNAAPLHRSGYGYGYGAYGAYGEYGQSPMAEDESSKPRKPRKALRPPVAREAASSVDA
ncbi:MAG: polysaccharide biosynthesis tyrosine autokinase, partial [Myxococcota bacterium]